MERGIASCTYTYEPRRAASDHSFRNSSELNERRSPGHESPGETQGCAASLSNTCDREAAEETLVHMCSRIKTALLDLATRQPPSHHMEERPIRCVGTWLRVRPLCTGFPRCLQGHRSDGDTTFDLTLVRARSNPIRSDMGSFMSMLALGLYPVTSLSFLVFERSRARIASSFNDLNTLWIM